MRRMSEASFKGWRRLPGLAKVALGAFQAVHARSELDAARLRVLGASSVVVAGDLKFAADQLPVDETELLRLRATLGTRPIWLAASTHDGEEAVVLAAHRALLSRCPDLLTILVPRHPERGEQAAALAGEIPLTRRSASQDPPIHAGVWLVDTLGELGLCYRLAGVAFIGNSLRQGWRAQSARGGAAGLCHCHWAAYREFL